MNQAYLVSALLLFFGIGGYYVAGGIGSVAAVALVALFYSLRRTLRTKS